ncbi:protein lin-52 homolog isoform X2 [Limulus polyphemus]|nr:protein lin-52 homolog isoform X2 [Limulus polyphemus]XP_022248326.1 protein lin-52 homolog isoform X2 [Limulus polyphemus]XP_022248327.1 protein lin-52 homolog isoform X2 [Limulus polyphemus]
MEPSLLSQEKLDRSSPELWPEQIPGVSEFAALTSPVSGENSQPEWKDIDQEDVYMMQGFGSLTAAALIEKVKALQNLAYQLGVEEAREMTRGRFLNILERKKPQRRK